MSPPRIAIMSCSKIADYEAAVRAAGGEPVVVDPATELELVHRCDGLLLTGGGDVNPSLYGEIAHPTVEPAEPGRDEFEMALANRAIADDLPLLAICRGVQALNVARGGSLIQDIPSQIARSAAHKVSDPPSAIAHTVVVAPGSLLDELLYRSASGSPAPYPVNSRHHQAVKAPGSGLVVTATAPDGVIEAVEDPSRAFCLGVQWHPENFWGSGEFAALFDRLVKAARTRKGRTS